MQIEKLPEFRKKRRLLKSFVPVFVVAKQSQIFYTFPMNQIPILYENSDILIVNKQSGLAVQGGQGILHPLDEVLPQQVGQKVYLVHRLDRDTAGILLVAKSPKAAAEYTKIFAGKSASKEYIAFSAGIPDKKTGTISQNVNTKGVEKNALTMYKILNSARQTGPDGEAFEVSKLSLSLGTGRMHQIRIHLASINAPVIADDKHGNFSVNKKLKKLYGAKKLMLAAWRLTLPVEGRMQTFSIDLPEHMVNFEQRFFAGGAEE